MGVPECSEFRPEHEAERLLGIEPMPIIWLQVAYGGMGPILFMVRCSLGKATSM